jgi:hypothetical protein
MKDITTMLAALGKPKRLISQEIGISRSYFYDVIQGRRQPTVTVAGAFLDYLNHPENLKRLGRRRPVTFEELFGSKAAA